MSFIDKHIAKLILLLFCALSVNAYSQGRVEKYLEWDFLSEMKGQAFDIYRDTTNFIKKNRVKTITTTDYDSLVYEVEKFDEEILCTEDTKYFAEGTLNKSKKDTLVERYYYTYNDNRKLVTEKMLTGNYIFEKKYFYTNNTANELNKYETYVNSEHVANTYLYYNTSGKIDSVIMRTTSLFDDHNTLVYHWYLYYNNDGRIDSVKQWDQTTTKIIYDSNKLIFDEGLFKFEYSFQNKMTNEWVVYVADKEIVRTEMHYLTNGLTNYGKSVFTSKKNRDRPLVRAYHYEFY